jgi:hypothetical protein
MRSRAVLVGFAKCGPIGHSVFRNNLFRKTETRASFNSAMITSTYDPRATKAPKAAGPRRAVYTVFTHPPEAAKKEKNGRGGRCNQLKRLDSEKTNQGFPRIVLWPSLAGFGQIWENLEFSWNGMAAMTCSSATSQGRGAMGSWVVPTVDENIGFDRLGSRKGGRTTGFRSAAASERDRDEIRS